MSEQNQTLRIQKLAYLGELRIHPNIFEGRFPSGCATNRCKGVCCRNGVWVDVGERDQIVANADLIRRHMDPDQEQDTASWFDPEPNVDPDFPSGKAVSTGLRNGACVFLNSARRCVLQTASEHQPFDLKPFFCTAFPVTIDHGELQVDDKFFDDSCCTLTPDGQLTVMEVCEMEMNHVLGAAGVRDLRALMDSKVGLNQG